MFRRANFLLPARLQRGLQSRWSNVPQETPQASFDGNASSACLEPGQYEDIRRQFSTSLIASGQQQRPQIANTAAISWSQNDMQVFQGMPDSSKIADGQ